MEPPTHTSARRCRGAHTRTLQSAGTRLRTSVHQAAPRSPEKRRRAAREDDARRSRGRRRATGRAVGGRPLPGASATPCGPSRQPVPEGQKSASGALGALRAQGHALPCLGAHTPAGARVCVCAEQAARVRTTRGERTRAPACQ